MYKIYFAGGCFWGVEKFFSQVFGVTETRAGYANGVGDNPSYEEVCKGCSGFAETVEVEYNPEKISLNTLLKAYFSIIDPTSINKQGNDVGIQYRTGIYYIYDSDKKIINDFLLKKAMQYDMPIMVEVKKLENFYSAEKYHQKYLEKNPQGYCHLRISDGKKYFKPEEDEIREKLNDIQYKVTQENATEPPRSGVYDNFFEDGIYVDIVSGEPLFSSKDKFRCSCGWASFSSPINKEAVIEKFDNSHGMRRIEVRSKIADSHLGHVFNDGPYEKGCHRYCINSAAIKFIRKKDLEKEGYQEYTTIFE